MTYQFALWTLCYGLASSDDSHDELTERQQADARSSISLAHVAIQLVFQQTTQHNAKPHNAH
ncbi:hypothetical protein [Photobacterium indicum]|uniref:hypothetical protein n=1 Tax=Photobacterium indicum TaxID=81447 RepID=UPI003D0A3B70